MSRPLSLLLLLAPLTLAEDDPAAIAKRKAEHRPRMAYLNNGTIKLGVDLNLGGAIAYLSSANDDANVVNNWDWGRQIQMSHYSGPTPFRVPGKEPAKAWAGFGWNPVQAGDHFGHPSKVLESRIDGKELFVRARPMQWSLPDVPSECEYETRITLDGPTARIRCRVKNLRTDKTAYPAHDQELPAVYVNGPYSRLMAYTGDKPFTGGDLSRIEKKPTKEDSFPWARFRATEHWAAQVNADGFGLGVYQPGCVSFLGGFAGKPGTGGTSDFATGYIAPTRQDHLDHNIEYAYEYILILGKLDEIRSRVAKLHGPPALPLYEFKSDRQGWTRAGPVTDTGWTMRDGWEVRPEKAGSQLIGPPTFWRAESAPVFKIEAAFRGSAKQAKVTWARHETPNDFDKEGVVIPIRSDGEMRAYAVKLADAADYRGGMARLRLELGAGDWVKVKSIRLCKE